MREPNSVHEKSMAEASQPQRFSAKSAYAEGICVLNMQLATKNFDEPDFCLTTTTNHPCNYPQLESCCGIWKPETVQLRRLLFSMRAKAFAESNVVRSGQLPTVVCFSWMALESIPEWGSHGSTKRRSVSLGRLFSKYGQPSDVHLSSCSRVGRAAGGKAVS